MNSTTVEIAKLNYLTELILGVRTDIDEIKTDNKLIINQLNMLLNNLVEKTQSIKAENRPLDEKIDLIEQSTMSIFLNNKNYEMDKQVYKKVLEKRILNWDQLDNNSCEFLIMGDYLFSTLHKANIQDYSACILQYTKALENGLFERYFKPFINNYSYEKQDFSRDVRINELKTFAKQILKGTENKILTMGNMVYVFRNMHLDYDLFKDFNLFISTQDFTLFNLQTVQDIDFITNNYRNAAAHTENLDYAKACECKEKVISTFDTIYM